MPNARPAGYHVTRLGSLELNKEPRNVKFYRQKPQPAAPPAYTGCAQCAANRVHLSRGTVSAVTSKVVSARIVARCKACGN